MVQNSILTNGLDSTCSCQKKKERTGIHNHVDHEFGKDI